VAWGLIDFHHIGQILRSGRAEVTILAATFGATLFLDLETAIMLGVVLSIGFYLSRTSRPRVVTRVPDPGQPRRKFSGIRTCRSARN
jgi:SulP family sulfate permease